jgi:hypothetical protein
MSLPKLVCAAFALMAISSCSTGDTKATDASSPPDCRRVAGEDHVLEKVGRTIFWLEIKLMEQTRKTSPECEAKPE